jgi:hypothetical protein
VTCTVARNAAKEQNVDGNRANFQCEKTQTRLFGEKAGCEASPSYGTFGEKLRRDWNEMHKDIERKKIDMDA